MDEKKKVLIRVTGKVQGVGFRQYTLRAAIRLGICGWVKNDPDGRVSILAVGATEKMDQFLTEVRNGPSLSQVKSLEQTDYAGDTEPMTFEVIR